MKKFTKVRQIDGAEVQPRIAKLLEEIAEVCKEHNLKWFMFGGTLLGAVRHSGFIPWDDDIDIAMPRDDYNKLIELQKQGKLKNTLVCRELNRDYNYLFAKYSEDGTYMKEKLVRTGKFGLYVDIFPLDGLGDTMEGAIKIMKRVRPWAGLYWATMTPMSIKWLFLIPPFTPLFFMNKFFARRMEKISTGRPFNKSEYVGKFNTRVTTRQIMPRSYYEELVQMPFEGQMYPAPKEYDAWLTKFYGANYMVVPTNITKSTHGFKAWEIEFKK